MEWLKDKKKQMGRFHLCSYGCSSAGGRRSERVRSLSDNCLVGNYVSGILLCKRG